MKHKTIQKITKIPTLASPVFDESCLSPLSNDIDPLHGVHCMEHINISAHTHPTALTCLSPHIPVVFDGHIPSSLKLEN